MHVEVKIAQTTNNVFFAAEITVAQAASQAYS